MALSIGIALALAVGAFARWFGLDRDRAFYPTVMMVIAFLYVLFAAIGGAAALPIEAIIGLGFATLAALGFKRSPWFVVIALVGHGLFDLVHPHAIENGGVPMWWPDFCSAYDIAAGAWLALQLYRARSRPPMSGKISRIRRGPSSGSHHRNSLTSYAVRPARDAT